MIYNGQIIIRSGYDTTDLSKSPYYWDCRNMTALSDLSSSDTCRREVRNMASYADLQDLVHEADTCLRMNC